MVSEVSENASGLPEMVSEVSENASGLPEMVSEASERSRQTGHNASQ